jgi:hypothetical protein
MHARADKSCKGCEAHIQAGSKALSGTAQRMLTLLRIPATLWAHPVRLPLVHSEQWHKEQAEHLVHCLLLGAAAVAHCIGSSSSRSSSVNGAPLLRWLICGSYGR